MAGRTGTIPKIYLFAIWAGVPLLSLTWGIASAQPAGTAEVRLNVPAGPQPLRTPFRVTIELASVSGTWAGYQTYVAYDDDLVEVLDISPGGIANCDTEQTWGNPSVPPFIQTGCAFQESTEVGIMEVITFQCLKDGRAPLRFVSREADPAAGTFIFDENAVYFDTKVTDGEIICGAGGPASTVELPTPIPTPDFSSAGGVSGSPSSSGGAGGGGQATGDAARGQGAATPASGQGNGQLVTSVGFLVPLGVVFALVAAAVAFGLRWRQRSRV
jgi:hypothetical protein